MRLRSKSIFITGAALALLSGGLVTWEVRHLPSVDELPQRLAARTAAAPRSTWVPLWAISPRLQTAVVAWEDPAFYHHSGLSLEGIWRAAIEDVRTREYTRGGSTITQQVAKNLFLSKEKTLRRKFDEAVLAWRLERRLSKHQILEIYLNIAEWGEGVFGAEAAAQFYFEKPARDLTWAEAALLAGMLPNPRRLDPRKAPEEALRRRRIILLTLLADGEINQEEFLQADAAPWRSQSNRTMPASRGGDLD